MNDLQWELQSVIGPLFLVASEKGLKGIFWQSRKVPMAESLSRDSPVKKVLRDTIRELEEYFAGKRKVFSVVLDVDGTPFQKRVWQELAKIPYGKTFSYSDIARRINNAKAVRAVGSANGRNPVSIMVPCHRVIAANGNLGGYAGGLSIKSELLRLEKPCGSSIL